MWNLPTCRILDKPTEELQHSFDTEHPDINKESLVYARSLLEFCSYQALNMMTKPPDYLADKKFRRLTFNMMLAWEGPSAENELNTVRPHCTLCSTFQILSIKSYLELCYMASASYV